MNITKIVKHEIREGLYLALQNLDRVFGFRDCRRTHDCFRLWICKRTCATTNFQVWKARNLECFLHREAFRISCFVLFFMWSSNRLIPWRSLHSSYGITSKALDIIRLWNSIWLDFHQLVLQWRSEISTWKLRKFFKKGIKLYPQDPTWVLVWDDMQYQFKCCGVNNHMDWTKVNLTSGKNVLKQSKEYAWLPFSCANGSISSNSTLVVDNVYTTGCFTVVSRIVNHLTSIMFSLNVTSVILFARKFTKFSNALIFQKSRFISFRYFISGFHCLHASNRFRLQKSLSQRLWGRLFALDGKTRDFCSLNQFWTSSLLQTDEENENAAEWKWNKLEEKYVSPFTIEIKFDHIQTFWSRSESQFN